MRLHIGGQRRSGRVAVWRPRHALHLHASLSQHEVVDGSVAGFKVCLESETICQQHTNGISLFQADLVICEPGEPGISGFVGPCIDVVEGIGDPFRCADNWRVKAVSNLDEGFYG